MGLFDRFKKVTPTSGLPLSGGQFYGAWQLSMEDYERILGLSPGEMWRTQPYLRTVVTFLARNIAQLSVQTFARVGDNDRQRLREGGVADVFARPNRSTTAYELIFALVADIALYDVGYWMLSDDPDQLVVRLPVDWVTPHGGDALGPAGYVVRMNDKGEAVDVPAENVLAFHGWHPGSLSNGSSPVHALREILAEQVQAAKYRETVWRRGGKVGAVLSRPADAPGWSDPAREQFKADWESKFTGDGPRVGGTPLLEDGMTLNRVDFSAHEMEFIEGSRLALNTVASVYHVNPTMIGLLDNANYSNVREFRRMLYGDTLGPFIAQLEDRLNGFLVPRYDTRPNVYVEFNIEEKLQGSFEEQTAALQASVGRPFMTANEARALRNMPAIDGGDELVTPLNVLVGGQASPQDSTPKAASSPAAVPALAPPSKGANLFLLKARAADRQAAVLAGVVRKSLDRQGAVVLSAAGDPASWDGPRWDRELVADLLAAAAPMFTPAPGALEPEVVRLAGGINAATKSYLDAEDADPSDVFSGVVKAARSEGAGADLLASLTGLAALDAATLPA